jgi:hypothetical protein
MGRSIRSKRIKKNNRIKRKEVFEPVELARLERLHQKRSETNIIVEPKNTEQVNKKTLKQLVKSRRAAKKSK